MNNKSKIAFLLAAMFAALALTFCAALAKPIKVPKRGPDITPPLVTTWIVDPDGVTVRITFNETVTGSTGFTYSMSGGAATLTYDSGSGSGTLAYTSSRTINSGETGTGAYTAGNVEDTAPATNNLANFTGFTIDNQSVQILGDEGAPVAPEEYEVPAMAADLATLETGATVITPVNSTELASLVNSGGTVDGTTLAAAAALGPVVIKLDNAVTYTGPFNFPALAQSDWIYVVPDTYDSLPPYGDRVDSGDSANLVAINPATSATLRPGFGVNHSGTKYRFVGIKSTNPVNGAEGFGFFQTGYANCTLPSQSVLSPLPTDIIVDRCWFLGRDASGQRERHCIFAGADGMAIVNCTLEGIGGSGSDPIGIFCYMGGSRYLFENNYISCSGEGIIFGGTDGDWTEIPEDIVVRGNFFTWPLKWFALDATYDGYARTLKNHFEIKKARRLLFENNIMKRHWLKHQSYVIAVTVRNQNGSAPANTVEDVKIQYNYVDQAFGFLNLTVSDDLHISDCSRRITITQNLARGLGYGQVGIGASSFGFGRSNLAGSTNTANHWRYTHNTMIDGPLDGNVYRNAACYFNGAMDGYFTSNLIFRDNLIECGLTPSGTGVGVGLIGTGLSEGTATLNAVADDYQFEKNVFFDQSGTPTYPANNYTGSTRTPASIQFEDYDGGDYRLAAGSPYNNLATDGTDIGCDVATLMTRIANVESGETAP
jgi:hypothetical protein